MAALAAASAWAPAWSEDGPQNLDAGKTPAQVFASDCGICHKSPQGLARSGALFGLEGFLREHYTSSRETAAVLAKYLRAAGDAPAPTRGRAAKRPPKGDAKPAAGKPAPDKSAENPNEAKPAGSSSDAKPEAKPADAKPVEAKPVETAPADSKPVESKPADPKPESTPN
ncbi:MAG: hypothetical protein ACR2K5_10555 [Pseudolabrys sp.]